jgi:hypothetical protein
MFSPMRIGQWYLRRQLLVTCCLWCAIAAPASGQMAATVPASASAAATGMLPPDLQAELEALRGRWEYTATLAASVGWRDNILLSPFAPIERPFGRAELEGMLWRPMRDRWEVISFLSGDVLRYASAPVETRGDQQWALHAEGRFKPVNAARFGLKATGYFSDTVIDLSETEAQRTVAPTRVVGGYATANVRVTLPWGFTFEPAVQVRRTDYREFPGDYDEVRSGGRLEWRGGERLALSAAWFEHRRRYADRTQFSAGGRPLAGTRLRFDQEDAEIKVRTGWNLGGNWSLATSVGRLENRDGASGYFDYDQKRSRLELEWQRASWRLLLDSGAKRIEYLVQTSGAGMSPPPRISEDYDVSLRAEREWRVLWTFFAEYQWERNRSNELEFSYRANTVLFGVQRSF